MSRTPILGFLSGTATSVSRSEASIDAAAVGNAQDQDHKPGVSDRVDDPIVADSDTPQVRVADQRSSAAGSRIGAQRVGGLHDPTRHRPVELGQLAFGSY